MFSVLLFIGVLGTVKRIALHQVVSDAIDAYDYKVYELVIDNPEHLLNKSLVVALLPQIGDPKVAVDCDTQPKLFDYYEWQTSYWFMQQLSVSYQERKTLNCTDQTFFIGVSSEVVAGYELIAYLQNGIQILEFNIPLSGELVPKEILEIKLLPTQENEKITLQIQANQANVYLKQCTGDCHVTENDFINNDTDTGMLIQQQSLSFLHTNCNECFYLIALQSDHKQPYRIMAKHNESHILLREGQTDQYHVDEGFFVYYQYTILNDTNIKAVKFQLTTYNGSCIMYGSSTNQYPNVNDISNPTQLSVNGAQTYYMSVYGQTYCVYGIYTQVEREQTINQTRFIRLQSGVPQKYLQSETYSFFEIYLISKQNFTINLQNINGNFEMFVKSDTHIKEIPDSNSYQWKDQKQIKISTNDPNYSNTYYISVLKLDDSPQSEFQIQYTLNGDVEFHQVGDQIIGTVKKNQYHYYKFPLQQRDIIITKDVYSNNEDTDLVLYISFKNQHPDKFSNYYMVGPQLTIPENEYDCTQKLSEKNSCYLYIAATSEGNTIFYTITTKYNNTQIQLHEGYPQTLTFDQETLFYYLLNKQEVSIQWYSYGGSQAEIEAYFGNLENPQLQFDKFKCEQQCYTQFQSIIVPASEKYKVLFIKVTPYGVRYLNDTYTLGVYEEVKLLTQSDPAVDYVSKGMIKYYRIILSEDAQSLVFNLHIFSGKDLATLYLSKGRDSRPTHLQSDIQSAERLGSMTIFQNQSHIDQPLQAGDYILAVHGIEDCDYQLSYNIDNARFFYAFQGYPFDVHFKEQIPHYYTFYQGVDKPFKITLITMKGKLQIQVRLFNDEIESINNNETLFINDIVTKQSVYRVDKCESQNCIYLVELIAQDGDAQGVLEFSDYEYQLTLYDGLEWSEILNETESVDYVFYSSHDIQINMQLISGDVRLYIKEGDQFEHNDEADFTIRLQKDQLISYTKKTNYRKLIIRVEGLTKDSYYKINVRDQHRAVHTLHLGQMASAWIPENTTTTFQYQSITNEQGKFITLQIQDVHQSLDKIFTDVKHNSIKPINYFNKYPKAISYHLHDTFGLYEITIKSYVGSYVRIVITNGELNALIDGIAQYHLTKVGQPNYYEIFLQQQSRIFIEAFTCSGTVMIQGTKEQTNLARQIFEIQMMNTSQAHLQSILTLDSGKYYFMVKLVSSHTQDENKNKVSSYYIRQQTFDQGEIVPYTSFEYTRKSVEWFKMDDKLVIHVPNLLQIQKEIPVTRVYFIVRMQQAIGEKSLACMFESNYVNNKTNLYGKYTQQVNQSESGNITTVTFITKDEQPKFVSVVGKVQIQVGQDVEELTYPLPIVEMNYDNSNSQEQIQQWVLLGLFLLILFFMGFFIYANIRRSVPHQNHNTLNIEMNYQTFH